MRSEDETFVNRCLEGDQAAFDFLVNKYKELVHAYAYHRIGDYQEAQDVAQEVFIKAYSKLGQLKWPHRFQSWLYTIVSNECKMWHRSHSKKSGQETPWEDVPVEDLNELAVRAHGDKDIELTVKSALETLPGDNQLALSLYYMSDLSIKEIASFMGVSPNTVKSKLHRARRQLGERLADMLGRQLGKKKLRSGFIITVVDSIRDMPIPSLPKPSPTKWMPIPVSIGLALLIGVIGYGISSGKDVSPDTPILRPAEATFEVSLLPDPDGQGILDMASEDVHESDLVAANTGSIALTQSAVGTASSGAVIRQVWAASREPVLSDYMGAPSPDGRYLSFTNWTHGNLAVRDLTTGEYRDLTDEGTWDEPDQFAGHSIWSPDSKQIAYSWSNEDHWELRIVGLDGSEPRVLYCDKTIKGFYGVAPSTWSQDGKYILTTFYRTPSPDEEVWEISLVSVSDGSVRVLKSLKNFRQSEQWYHMSLSPDGRHVAYARHMKEHGGARDIFLLAADGSGEETPLVEHPADDYGPIWAPDGKTIVFVSDRSGAYDAWLMKIDYGKPAGEPQLAKRDTGQMKPRGFTREGSLYYGLSADSTDVYTASIDPATGELLEPPTRAIRRFEGRNLSPAWSPDGKSLAYVSLRPSPESSARKQILVIRSLETGEEREVIAKTSVFSPTRQPQLRWSPDGRSILSVGKSLRLINVQTGDVTSIVQFGSADRINIFDCVWSPDGKTILYIRQVRTGQWPHSIVAHDLETGKEKELYRGNISWPGLAISPDGRRLVFAGAGALKAMPIAGGEPRVFHRLQDTQEFATEAMFSGLTWTADGRYILFVIHNLGQPGPPELWRVPVEEGKPQKLLGMDGLRDISVHPDGRRITFSGGWSRMMEVWTMENFLPLD
ncbi:sigma-70 family RNA polymerase sigma factor [Candidatus Poribacteria bacterium]